MVAGGVSRIISGGKYSEHNLIDIESSPTAADPGSTATVTGAVRCAAMLIAAPASGHGKTSITAALARLHRRSGLRVRCFKTGPDFIDPTMLVQASGHPVYNLDTWMMGVEHCRELLFEAAQSCDLILVEGAMGLFDGEPSSADLAQQFGLPILPVINAASMAQTFGALLHGLMTYRPGLEFVGAVANRVASARHEQMLRMSVPAELPLSIVMRSDAVKLPERHLGLQIADEIGDLDERIDALADLLQQTPLAQLPPAVTFTPPLRILDTVDVGKLDSDKIVVDGASVDKISASAVMPLLADTIIAVAFDAAFCFLYQANLEWLQRLGARLHIFSPLDDAELPTVDAIYLPGGYPELHAAKLAANTAMQHAINAHINAGKPVLAECGGMMYLTDRLIDLDGKSHDMLGVLPGDVAMAKRLSAIGPQQLDVDGFRAVRGHTFHYSSFVTTLTPTWSASTPNERPGEAVYCFDAIIASYVHWYFPSNPNLIAHWLLGADRSGASGAGRD